MAADESGQSSGLSVPMDTGSSGNTPQAGDSPQPIDVDNRPIGACYSELKAVKAAVDAARAADARVKDALAAFWQCRDAAAATAGIQSPSTAKSSFLATTFDGREDDLRQIEKLIEPTP